MKFSKYKYYNFFSLGKPALLFLVLLTLISFFKNFNEIILRYLNNPEFFKVFFSDFYLIYVGSEILNNDLNPYKEWIKLQNSPLFNPPLVFYFFKSIVEFNYYTIVKLWFFITLISFFSIPIILFKIFKIHQNFYLNILFFLFCFGGITIPVFLTGNISIILNTFFALGLFFLSKKKDHYFYIILSILSIIKFPYLIFFGLPFLLRNLDYKIFSTLVFYLSMIILFYLIFYFFDKELFISWIVSLKFSSQIGDSGDYGRGLFKILNYFFRSNIIVNYFCYFFISISLFLIILFVSKSSKFLKKNTELLIAFGIIALSICLPRLKSYDLLITIPSILFILQNLKFKHFNGLDPQFFTLILCLMLFAWTSPFAPITLSFAIVIILALDIKFNFIENK